MRLFNKKQKKSEYLKAMYNDINRYKNKTDSPTEKILYITLIFTSNYYNYKRNHIKLFNKYLYYKTDKNQNNDVRDFFIRICSDLNYITELIMSEVNPNVHIALDKHSLFIETTFKIVSSPYWINYSFDKEILENIQKGLAVLVKDIKKLQEIKLVEYEQEKQILLNNLLAINESIEEADSKLEDSKKHSNKALKIINTNISTLKTINNDLLESIADSHLLENIKKDNYSRIVHLNFNAFDKINKDIKIFDFYEYLNWYNYSDAKINEILSLLNDYQLNNEFKSENQKKIFEKYRIKFISLKHMLKSEGYSYRNLMTDFMIENYCMLLKLGVIIDSCLENTKKFLFKLHNSESMSDNNISNEIYFIKNRMEQIRLSIRGITRFSVNSVYTKNLNDLIHQKNDSIDTYILDNPYFKDFGINHEKYSENMMNVIKSVIEFATNNSVLLRKLKDISQYLLLYSYEKISKKQLNISNLYETFSLLTIIQQKFNVIFKNINKFNTSNENERILKHYNGDYANRFDLKDIALPNTTNINEVLQWVLKLDDFLDDIINNLQITNHVSSQNAEIKYTKDLITKKELINLVQNTQNT